MKRTRTDIMGMPITVEVLSGNTAHIECVFDFFSSVDAQFSTYKYSSDVSRFNRGELSLERLDSRMLEILRLADDTRRETDGYFDIRKQDGTIDPSGIVKGWAISEAASLLDAQGVEHFCIDAGGDIETRGYNLSGEAWTIGIRNPFDTTQIIKRTQLTDAGMATSGTYIRGRHIYNPHEPSELLEKVASISVIGPSAYEADRFATAAFAMGENGIHFIEGIDGLEAYSIDASGRATFTSNFPAFVV